jgi:hypothetical protein
MASSKNSSTKPPASLANATQKTRSAIQNLQARLTGATHFGVSSEPAAGAVLKQGSAMERLESEEELERQLEAYFARATRSSGSVAGTSSASRTQILDELRRRVIDGVVERILAEWAGGQSGAPMVAGLGNEVAERLIERVLQQFRTTHGALKNSLPS